MVTALRMLLFTASGMAVLAQRVLLFTASDMAVCHLPHHSRAVGLQSDTHLAPGYCYQALAGKDDAHMQVR